MVKVKVGFEAEIIPKTLFIYDEDVNLEKLVNDVKPNLLWIELPTDDYREIIERAKKVMPPQNIYVVCNNHVCVRSMSRHGVNVIYDVKIPTFDNVFVRIKVEDSVWGVVTKEFVIKPRRELYKFDRVIK